MKFQFQQFGYDNTFFPCIYELDYITVIFDIFIMGTGQYMKLHQIPCLLANIVI